LIGSLQAQLFGIILFVSQRISKNANAEEELTGILKDGLSKYCRILTGVVPAGMETVGYRFYARHILLGLRHKKRGSDLGEDNAAISIHGLVDLVDFTVLCIYKEAVGNLRAPGPASSPLLDTSKDFKFPSRFTVLARKLIRALKRIFSYEPSFTITLPTGMSKDLLDRLEREVREIEKLRRSIEERSERYGGKDQEINNDKTSSPLMDGVKRLLTMLYSVILDCFGFIFSGIYQAW
jgi:hypothetical protein